MLENDIMGGRDEIQGYMWMTDMGIVYGVNGCNYCVSFHHLLKCPDRVHKAV